MKKQTTFGAAALLAMAAVVGLSMQPGGKQTGEGTNRNGVVRRPESSAKTVHLELKPGCRSLEEHLQDFLETKDLIAPKECYLGDVSALKLTSKGLAERTSRLRFVVALLPDPLHTHLSVLFDQSTAAIQEASQDENYDFDSSWLPWEDSEQSYPLLADQETASLRKEARENQPGVLLFRAAVNCSKDAVSKNPQTQQDCKDESVRLGSGGKERASLSESYREGLVIFLVGEEATHGIRKEQFRNALKWIQALGGVNRGSSRHLGILGPTFSGSLPSLTQLLAEPETAAGVGVGTTSEPLLIHSGSVTGKDPAETFQRLNGSKLIFHSFLHDDDDILAQFCKYLGRDKSKSLPRRIAILSEDETAYGKFGVEPEVDGKKPPADPSLVCRNEALYLYYPRDISALRGAYQTRSLFDAGIPASAGDSQRRSLPTDLADPAGRVHDSIRSYGANQTPLVQEAMLLDIVAALRDLHARYILLRGSNTLDQLFLTNFLRRMYPDGRVVIFGFDQLFVRERGATGLGGAMTLSTYPPYPLARDWTEYESLAASDRRFSSYTAEGTYIALRTLLNSSTLRTGPPDPKKCSVSPDRSASPDHINVFLPAVSCGGNPIPDYSQPHWIINPSCQCEDSECVCQYQGPPIWLSVIGRNRFWPVAALGAPEQPTSQPDGPACPTHTADKDREPGRILEMPPEMKAFLIALAAFALFHTWCCISGSYTAKPSFRAYFAHTGERSHFVLLGIGSLSVAFSAIAAAWGCGAMSAKAYEYAQPKAGLYCAIFVGCLSLAAMVGSGLRASQLSAEPQGKWVEFFLVPSGVFVAALVLCLALILSLDGLLHNDNRAFTYWRAMHLLSGVSPLIPILAICAGLYLWFWFTLHGLALFGPDRPCLPLKKELKLKLKDDKGQELDDPGFLRMFSQEDAGAVIEKAGRPLDNATGIVALIVLATLIAIAYGVADGAPIRGLGAQSYARFIMVLCGISASLQVAGVWRLYELWEEVRRLLAFLDRLPLRRTMATLRGFSWGSVWKMSGNVLEVRYKVVSRQMESMNHAIAALQGVAKNSVDEYEKKAADICVVALNDMQKAGFKFAGWYSQGYTNSRAKNLTDFQNFQTSVATATGSLLTNLLIPAWMKEKHSLLMSVKETKEDKEEKGEDAAGDLPTHLPDEHLRNAEEFVCLTYLAFIQNILGRLRTHVMSVLALFLALTLCLSSYPFDPQQTLSAVLAVLLVGLGAVIVKVYAEMHRDATLSHVTNTKPGELGTEFWLKLFTFGFAPILGLLARIFPGVGDVIFSWIQPSISSLH